LDDRKTRGEAPTLRPHGYAVPDRFVMLLAMAVMTAQAFAIFAFGA
jgi:hypothetical protein